MKIIGETNVYDDPFGGLPGTKTDDVDEVFGAYDEPYTLDMVVAILALQDGIIHALKYEENM
ncbi:hypothetical protein RIB2604_00103240 [Aspergillus luchuensis]|uniref:Uncharacterized protein n=1 Tax=Aspergillus kawachii TaxID=1069201 RepID=A0A146EXV9_ASPKA|nr:hypothetical protein RIB2604_00103240 [Aspergillus luchuensis]